MKKLLLAILAFTVALSLCACGESNNDKNKKDTEMTTTDQKKTTQEETTEASVKETTEVSAVKSLVDVNISDNWEDFEFIIDGGKYKLPFAYADLQAKGWSFNLQDYGYPDGYVLNPEDGTYCAINLENTKYNKDINFTVGFKNTSTEVKDIRACDIKAIEIDVAPGTEILTEIPDILLSKGIAWGSTKEEVVAAFGTPYDTYEDKEFGYWSYTYQNEDYERMEFTIFNYGGVRSVKLHL